jgi:hypothetical protein
MVSFSYQAEVIAHDREKMVGMGTATCVSRTSNKLNHHHQYWMTDIGRVLDSFTFHKQDAFPQTL